MALNKLKKWIGTQAMTAFFDQLNDNVDATNDHMEESASDDVHGLANAVIVESGSNARGSYIKWGDGTMICTNHSFTLYYVQSNTLQSTWTYPVPFINDNVTVLPVAALSPEAKNMNTTVALRNVYAASAQIALYSPSGSWVVGDTREAKLVAFGMWK